MAGPETRAGQVVSAGGQTKLQHADHGVNAAAKGPLPHPPSAKCAVWTAFRPCLRLQAVVDGSVELAGALMQALPIAAPA